MTTPDFCMSALHPHRCMYSGLMEKYEIGYTQSILVRYLTLIRYLHEDAYGLFLFWRQSLLVNSREWLLLGPAGAFHADHSKNGQ